jgi:hypothetical protein
MESETNCRSLLKEVTCLFSNLPKENLLELVGFTTIQQYGLGSDHSGLCWVPEMDEHVFSCSTDPGSVSHFASGIAGEWIFCSFSPNVLSIRASEPLSVFHTIAVSEKYVVVCSKVDTKKLHVYDHGGRFQSILDEGLDEDFYAD